MWSSTYVRMSLAAGDVAGAAEALGRPYAVRGVVVQGDQRGRELGYPTANVPTDSMTAAPPDGVYAGWLRRLDTGERYPAAISVGTNPTFDGERDRRVESYVLDRTDLELYGVEVEVSFVERLRGMVAFESRRGPRRADDGRRRPRPRAAGLMTPATRRAAAPRPRSGSRSTACPTSCPTSAPPCARRCGRAARCRCWSVVVLVAVAAGVGLAVVLRRDQRRAGRAAGDRAARGALVRPDRAARPPDRGLGAEPDVGQPAAAAADDDPRAAAAAALRSRSSSSTPRCGRSAAT